MTTTTNPARDLSRALSAAAAEAGRSVLRLDARQLPASAIVWSADGVLIAASHAIEDDDEVEVALPDGSARPARVVGRDPSTDLAALRVEAQGLVPVTWADASPGVGGLVLAVSRPGRSPRAALGALAAEGEGWRTHGGGRVERYLEADVGLHPGLSGGLLVDVDGRGLGLLTSGLLRGRAVALPPEALRRVVEGLLAHGAVRRGYLGVATLPVRLGAALAQTLGQPSGVLLTGVEPGSPADAAGLLLGDAVVSFDGRPVRDVGDLMALLDDERVDRDVPVRVVRAGRLEEHTVRIGEKAGLRGRPGGES